MAKSFFMDRMKSIVIFATCFYVSIHKGKRKGFGGICISRLIWVGSQISTFSSIHFESKFYTDNIGND